MVNNLVFLPYVKCVFDHFRWLTNIFFLLIKKKDLEKAVFFGARRNRYHILTCHSIEQKDIDTGRWSLIIMVSLSRKWRRLEARRLTEFPPFTIEQWDLKWRGLSCMFVKRINTLFVFETIYCRIKRINQPIRYNSSIGDGANDCGATDRLHSEMIKVALLFKVKV